MDGVWGSHPIATLETRKVEREAEDVAHAAADHCEMNLQLKGVSRLLEAILLEMPS